MDIRKLPETFNRMARRDPYWAALTHRDNWTDEEFYSSGRALAAKILETASGLRVHRFDAALDFGCGPGRIAQALSERFKAVIGVDISPVMLAKAVTMNRHTHRCSYILNAAPNLERFSSGSFDLVHSAITLQHVAPSLALVYVGEFIRLLRSDGMAIFDIPEKPAPGVLGTILRVAPAWVLRPIRKLDMYGHCESKVREAVESAGGRVLLKEQAPDAGPRWISWRYYCTR